MGIAVFAVMVMVGNANAQGPGRGMVVKSCAAEIEKHCSGIPHGAGQIPKCLEEHLKELSDTCKAALENRGPKGPGRGRMRQQQSN